MRVLASGCSHKTAAVDLRERIAIHEDDLSRSLGVLADTPGVAEVVLLSTCNRTEIYTVAADTGAAEAALAALAADRGVPLAAKSRYGYADGKAVGHLMRVASGLDSMIVGETQVQGQVRDAYQAARRAGATGKILNALFERTLAAAHRVHRETGISRHAVSTASAAAELARKVFGDLRRQRALILGAGEAAELVAVHLRQSHIGELWVASRTRARAEALARRHGGRALPLDCVAEHLAGTDVVVAATAARGHLLAAADVRAATAARAGEPMLLVDLAVPRDVDPEAAGLPGVFLYNIDDLRNVVAANLRAREREAQRAERLLAQEAASFLDWLASLEVVPAIRALREKVDGIRRTELERTLARLPDLDPRQREVIVAMSSAITQKILNEPTLRLKEMAGGPAADGAVAAIYELFRLQPGASGRAAASERPATPQVQAGD